MQEFLRKTVTELNSLLVRVVSFGLSVQRGENTAQAAVAAATYSSVAQLHHRLAAMELAPGMQDLKPAMQEVDKKVDEFKKLIDNELEELRGSVHEEYRDIGLRRQVHRAFGVPKSDEVCVLSANHTEMWCVCPLLP